MESKDNIFINRIQDYISLASDKDIVNHTNFLNPYEQSLAMDCLFKHKNIAYSFYGGYKNAERRILSIQPNYDWAAEIIKPLVVIKITFSKHDLRYNEHRSILGATLGLGIRREAIGDIIINDDMAYLITDDKIGQFIHTNLLTVGRATVNTDLITDTGSIDFDAQDSFVIKKTIASLRIDAILAAALKTSRSKAAKMISEDLVFIDWRIVKKPTLQVEVGQIISIRHKGRISLVSIGSKSHKDRIWVEIECWL